MTWYTKSDHYSKPKFSADIEKLKSLYQDTLPNIEHREGARNILLL
jgi:outer membrane protein assembly factor BamA